MSAPVLDLALVEHEVAFLEQKIARWRDARSLAEDGRSALGKPFWDARVLHDLRLVGECAGRVAQAVEDAQRATSGSET